MMIVERVATVATAATATRVAMAAMEAAATGKQQVAKAAVVLEIEANSRGEKGPGVEKWTARNFPTMLGRHTS